MHESFFHNIPAMIAVAAAAIITASSAYWSRVALPKQMDRAYRASLYALAAAVEAKDSSAIGHARRVADHAVAMAQDLGQPPDEVQRIEHAALLRDIGKVNIPHSLLNKAEPLTPEEFERIKSHISIGADMATQTPFLARCAEIIRRHHERWDGSGYPDGLQAHEIPLGARILAVADDFDAMTSDRPYHKALSRQAAIDVIRDGAGTSYDPAVVESFLKILEKESRA